MKNHRPDPWAAVLALGMGLCLFSTAAFALERKAKSGDESEDAGEIFQADTDLIDIPTAGVLDYASYSGHTRFFSNGGVIGKLSFGVFQRLNLGASLNIDQLIGNKEPIQLTSPELQLKYRFYDGGQYLPATAVGFDGQGLFYDRLNKEYIESRRGLYLAGTKEVVASGVFVHGGFNISDFDHNAFRGFLGSNWNIEDKVSLIAEWDNIGGGQEARINAGLRAYATPFLQIDFAVREIGRGGRSGGTKINPERIVEMKYTGSF